MLGSAALRDPHRSEPKLAPLFSQDESGTATLRIRSLQHMTVLHLQRVIAGEAEEIVRTENATAVQMERIRITMRDYGSKALSKGSVLHRTVRTNRGQLLR